ncbi:unnamed protein product [Timema podura]|uniref:Uncharacterized protein n=1 Tax=Timema podura TaxID=61482 RepID=A0ABN7P4R3_TIMPD|nr:unnamed protein product [Timema podura]
MSAEIYFCDIVVEQDCGVPCIRGVLSLCSSHDMTKIRVPVKTCGDTYLTMSLGGMAHFVVDVVMEPVQRPLLLTCGPVLGGLRVGILHHLAHGEHPLREQHHKNLLRLIGRDLNKTSSYALGETPPRS